MPTSSWRLFLLCLVVLLLSTVTIAQDNCPCCTASHDQFDFFLGEWTVRDTHGKEVGQNRIEELEGGCLIRETWTGASGFTGRSFNYFDTRDSTWNQVWVDPSGVPLNLKGTFENQRMDLRSEFLTGQDSTLYRNRIIWIPNPDGTVTQIWDILDEGETIKMNVFHGIYHPN